MPDQNRELASLQEEVELLKNALKRERSLKKRLEAKLEAKAQSTFDSNKSFLDAYQKSTSRQIQLQFLANLTSGMFEQQKISDMICRFFGNISTIIEQFSAFEFTIKQGKVVAAHQLSKDYDELNPIDWPFKLSALTQRLEQIEFKQNWQRIEIQSTPELADISEFLSYSTLLFFHFKLTNARSHLLVLNIDHYCYSTEFKQTLDTAAQQFSLAIRRRLTEVELANKVQQLTTTLAELKATQQQLTHSEKMASLGQLAAGVAHEVNNPLGFISSNLSVLLDYQQTYDQAFKYIGKNVLTEFDNIEELEFALSDTDELINSCIKGVIRIRDIVSSLKTFSRKDSGEFTPIDINEVIDTSLTVAWNNLKYNYQVEQNLLHQPPKIIGNKGQLQQVFINLFINASHAMADTGTLTIGSCVDEDKLKVTVADTGCGMSEQVIKRLFEPFFTTKAENKGTGLGLSVSYAIIERHKGSITVQSTPNKGSTFSLCFPIFKDE